MNPPPDKQKRQAGRLPPNSVDAEQAAIGAALISKTAAETLVERLRWDDYYIRAHQLIHAAIAHLESKDLPVDTLSVSEELRRRDQLDEIGGIAYLMTCTDCVPTALHVGTYIDAIDAFSYRRALIGGSGVIAEMAYDLEVEAEDVRARSESIIEGINTRKQIVPIYSTRELNEELLLNFCPGAPVEPNIPTGFARLDEMLPGRGYALGELSILCGRPSMGKSTAGVQLSLSAAAGGFPVGVLSLEMTRHATYARYLANLAHKNLGMILERAVEDWGVMSAAADTFAKLPIFLVDEPDLPLSQIRAVVRRMIRQHGVRIIYIDQLQVIGKKHKRQNNEEMEEIVYGLSALAKKEHVHIVLMCQLNRNSTEREEKRPTLTDLRNTGSLEQAARVVIGLHRPEYYLRNTPGQRDTGTGGCEFLLMKSHNGGTGILTFQCNLAECRIWDDRVTDLQPAIPDFGGGMPEYDVTLMEPPPDRRYGRD